MVCTGGTELRRRLRRKPRVDIDGELVTGVQQGDYLGVVDPDGLQCGWF